MKSAHCETTANPASHWPISSLASPPAGGHHPIKASAAAAAPTIAPCVMRHRRGVWSISRRMDQDVFPRGSHEGIATYTPQQQDSRGFVGSELSCNVEIWPRGFPRNRRVMGGQERR